METLIVKINNITHRLQNKPFPWNISSAHTAQQAFSPITVQPIFTEPPTTRPIRSSLTLSTTSLPINFAPSILPQLIPTTIPSPSILTEVTYPYSTTVNTTMEPTSTPTNLYIPTTDSFLSSPTTPENPLYLSHPHFQNFTPNISSSQNLLSIQPDPIYTFSDTSITEQQIQQQPSTFSPFSPPILTASLQEVLQDTDFSLIYSIFSSTLPSPLHLFPLLKGGWLSFFFSFFSSFSTAFLLEQN